jgi:triacylglycerol lipase
VYTIKSASPSGHIVVGIHGGAFAVEATKMHWRDYASIARDTNAAVVVPVYPLVPWGTASIVVPQLADLIASQMTQPGVESVNLYGDSAGGTLALAATQELVRRGVSTPDRVVLISPALDLTFSNPACSAVEDPVLSLPELYELGKLWAAELDLADPLVSPLFGALHGLPPIAVYAGSLDLLGPDTVRLRERAIAEHAEITFDLRKGLIHDWALPVSREGKAVRRHIYQQLLGSDF